MNGEILSVVKSFEVYLKELHERMDFPSWKNLTLNLEVDVSREKARFKIKFCAGYGEISEEGTDLEEVMEEVRRRLRRNEKVKGQIEASLAPALTLSSLSEERLTIVLDDEIPY